MPLSIWTEGRQWFGVQWDELYGLERFRHEDGCFDAVLWGPRPGGHVRLRQEVPSHVVVDLDRGTAVIRGPAQCGGASSTAEGSAFRRKEGYFGAAMGSLARRAFLTASVGPLQRCRRFGPCGSGPSGRSAGAAWACCWQWLCAQRGGRGR